MKGSDRMMQKLIINQLGPVKYCELDINKFIVFIGAQATGKSTVAKSIFFFKNIKNLLFSQLRKQYLLNSKEYFEDTIKLSLKNRLMREIRTNFLQIFGSTWCMDDVMYLKYYYKEDTFIKISLKEDNVSPNYIWIEFSRNFIHFLNVLQRDMQKESGFDAFLVMEKIRDTINQFFLDDSEIVYIPAGRSMITLLSTQLNYIYSSMDDTQKKNLDYCTQNYLERILQLKPSFSAGIEEMLQKQIRMTDSKIDRELLDSAVKLIHDILQGEYRNSNGDERLQVSDNRYVKINFASSGQQEVVWILNVIFYYLLNNKKAYFIIEEPESHLFPNAQKLITEFIALAQHNKKNQIFLTTHSPYILGTINNLLYANKIASQVDREKLERIIEKNRWIAFSDIAAYYMEQGKMQYCMDNEFESIENEIIDGASDHINDDYSRMLLLKEE